MDFNLAYNPYCAFNEYCSCPLTPFENRLKVAIPPEKRSPAAIGQSSLDWEHCQFGYAKN